MSERKKLDAHDLRRLADAITALDDYKPEILRALRKVRAGGPYFRMRSALRYLEASRD